MSALKVGQKVLTVNEDGTPSYTEVLTFLKRHPRTDAVYWNIRTDKSNIRMTPRHIVFTSASNDTATRQPRFAHDVSVGDYLFSASSSNITSSKVLEITSQIMTGVYVPLTETGTLVVDELLASCYSSVDHYIAHAFVTPIRWFPSLFRFHGEDYGMPGYVSFMKWLAHKILPSTYQGRYGQKKSGGELTFTGAHFMSLDL
ncbi:desert hedgehog protein B-like [Liolophura sinensis]|uniref:desert hedgehog protein B-like n=1 Tax=Liolophura sinensis TaxID=3198878 RepID=UPI00315980D8